MSQPASTHEMKRAATLQLFRFKQSIIRHVDEGKDSMNPRIKNLMQDLINVNVDFLTIGQYLQPSTKHHPLQKYYTPDEFEGLKTIAESKGFLLVSSSPLTRSSYHADEDFAVLKKNRMNQTNAKSIS